MVILVNREDEITGYGEKMEVHRQGLLHRAFSVLVFNSRDQLLLQKRAAGKYHSPGLWTNTCCSHPRPGETPVQAAHRRLQEEMGFDCDLEFAFKFVYRAPLQHGLTEHELDHVFTGRYDGPVRPQPTEVAEYKWISPGELVPNLRQRPEDYTVWFKIIIEKSDLFR